MNIHRRRHAPVSPIGKSCFHMSVFTEFSLLKKKMFLSWNSYNNTGHSWTPGLQFAAVAIATEAKVKDRKIVSSFHPHHNRNIFNLCMCWIIFCSSNWLAMCDKAIWIELICHGCHSNHSNYLLADNILQNRLHMSALNAEHHIYFGRNTFLE